MRDEIDYLVCNNEATLLWTINLGCIDVNPWASRTWSADTPDYITIDLDPTAAQGADEPKPAVNGSETRQEPAGKKRGHGGSGVANGAGAGRGSQATDKTGAHGSTRSLEKLRETAMAAKAYCDRIRVKAFAKTSGKTGMHFYLPCAGFNFEQARTIAEHICTEIHALAPKASTIENSVRLRGDLVYVDPSQNDYADTLAAPYCVRPYHTPCVSTPLEWREINARLDPAEFTIDTIFARLARKGDLFRGVLDPTIAAENTKKLARLFA
jgi:bifunctional non-homologous end joining protein LigD